MKHETQPPPDGIAVAIVAIVVLVFAVVLVIIMHAIAKQLGIQL